MFKRFIARLLIVLQIYSNLFQGVAHAADLADSYPIRNEIHLHSFMGEDGGMRLALGTNDIEDPNDLRWFDIPTYQKAKKLAPQTEVWEVEDENLSNDSDGDCDISTDDESSFEREGITRTPQATYFTLQGLSFSISNTGVMEISGGQTDRSKPIFLNCDRPIILNGIEANALKVTAPRIINRGQSTIDYLMLEGIEDRFEKTLFINDGILTAKELFLNNLNSDNRGTIASPSFGIYGEVEYTGAIETNALALEENAFLRLTEDSRADIKTLFLSKASHLENQHQAEDVLNIGVLRSLGGSITNLGTMAIGEIAEDSAFQAITNRHFMGIALGRSIKVETITNSGSFGIDQGSLLVKNGTNSGVLKANGLEVATDFTNDKTGSVVTQSVSGDGELINFGVMETNENLALNVQKFTNSGSVKAKSIKGLGNLENITNATDATIEATETLGFANTTKVINRGLIKAHDLTLVGNLTTQEGEIRVSNFGITGGGTFENLGDIDVEQCLTLNLGSLINKGNIEAKVVDGYKNLVTLKNEAGSLFKVRDGPLEFTNATVITNGGTIIAKDLKLSTDHTTLQKSGKLEATNITLSGDKPFTNAGSIIASQKLSLNLTKLINQQTIKASLVDTSKLVEFTNARGATFEASNSNLTFIQAKVVNDGSIKAGDYAFKGGSLTQNGNIEGKSLKTTDKAVVSTNDSQTMSLSGELESDTMWSMRGKINAQRFNRIGDIDLYGTLSLVDSFSGRGTIHKGSKLIAKHIEFYNDATVNGDLDADTLNAKSTFTLNGKALVKRQATVGGLFKVGKDGALVGIKHSQLSLILGAGSDIAGLVHVDTLDADKELTLTSTGQLIALKKAQLKADIKVAKGGLANLTGLVMGGTIYNDGKFKAVQGTGSSRLVNRGIAEIEADSSTYDQDKDLKLWLRNEKSGQLTLTRGDFDMRGDNPFENAGILIDNSRWMWLGKPKNTGIWYSPSCSLNNYNGINMGDFRVNGDLTVEALVDALNALEGLKQTQAKKIVMHADRLTIKQEQQFAMPLEFHIRDTLSVQAKLLAPTMEVHAKTLELGSANGGWGVLSAYKFGINITVDAFDNRFGHITAMQDAQIIVNGDKFVNGASALDPNHVETGASIISYPKRRNGAAISVGGNLKIAVKGQNALLNNHYGLMQADGHLNLFSQKQITNIAGTISSKRGGLLSAPEIVVRRDENSRNPYGNKYCNGHYYPKGGRQVRDTCSGGDQCTQRFYYREQSDEGWINVGGGDLEIDTDSLLVLASHIVSKGRLFLKRQNIYLPKNESGELKAIKGVLVQSRQDRWANEGMCGGQGDNLGIHKAGILSYSDMKLESHGLKIEGISTTQTMDLVQALTQIARNAGFDVTIDQTRDLFIDVASGAQSQSRQPHSLVTNQKGQYRYDAPHEKNEPPTYGTGPTPILTNNYETFNTNLLQNTKLQHTVSKRVLESLLDTLVLKALCNPQRSDFSRKIYENSQVFAINNMKQRLLQNNEAQTEEEAQNIVAVRYHQLIPITYEDMSVYAKDVKNCAKQMLLFELGANYRAIEKLKRMEDDLDQEICDLRPKVFVPKESLQTENTSAIVHSDSQITNQVQGDMTLMGAAQYSGHGGTSNISGNLKVEALTRRQGNTDNFYEQSSHPYIQNLGNNNEQNFIVGGDVLLTGARIDTGGKDNKTNIVTPGNIIDKALEVSSRSTTDTYDKRSHTKTVTDEVIMVPTEYLGSGELNANLGGSMYTQAPIIKTNLELNADTLNITEAHNRKSVQSMTETYSRAIFGGSTQKTTQESSQALSSKGGQLLSLQLICGNLLQQIHCLRRMETLLQLRKLK